MAAQSLSYTCKCFHPEESQMESSVLERFAHTQLITLLILPNIAKLFFKNLEAPVHRVQS